MLVGYPPFYFYEPMTTYRKVSLAAGLGLCTLFGLLVVTGVLPVF